MKFIIVLLLILSSQLFAQSFMPENDLWKEDGLFNKSNGMTRELFEEIVQAGMDAYKPIADANSEKLVINARWDDATVNANCSRWWGTVTINMYGGLARRDEVNPEGFALVLCHELGHAYGGYPYIQAWRKMSAEGQSDYYGSKECLKKIYPLLKRQLQPEYVSDFTRENCGADEDCLLSLSAGKGLGDLLSKLKNDPEPEYETPDETVVEQTQLSYPETVQCRLDTYFHGALSLDRPLCWFKD